MKIVREAYLDDQKSTLPQFTLPAKSRIASPAPVK